MFLSSWALYMQNIKGLLAPFRPELRFLPSTVVIILVAPHLGGGFSDRIGPKAR